MNDITGQTLYEPYAPRECRRVVREIGTITGGFGEDRLVLVVTKKGDVFLERLPVHREWSLEKLIDDHAKKMARHRAMIAVMDDVAAKADLGSEANAQKIRDGVLEFTNHLRAGEVLVRKNDGSEANKR